MNKWDRRMLGLAKVVATWSKDPSTGVGAVIADSRNRVVSLGFNGYPRKVEDVVHEREERLRRMIHAEDNALLFAARPVEGCAIFVTHPPCARCAAKIIQAGIVRVVSLPAGEDFAARWAVDFTAARGMYSEAGVLFEVLG